jgi:hypothetical protein
VRGYLHLWRRMLPLMLAAGMFLPAVSSWTDAQSESKAVTARGLDLKSMLYRDFSLDLKIAGGFGGSAAEAIIVTSSDPFEAAATQMLVLRGIGKGRGVLWRTLTRVALESGGKWLEQIKIETKDARSTEIVTQRENYYFDVVAADPRHEGLPPASGFVDPKIGLSLPYEIGWLHLDNVIDNEPMAKGFGQTLAYGAPGIKATVYVYDKGRTDIPANIRETVPTAEFAAAVSELRTVHPDSTPLGNASQNDTMIRQAFLIDGEPSVLALGVSRGKFIKIRITSANDPILRELVEDLLTFFRELVTGGVRIR